MTDQIKAIKKASRELFKDMPRGRRLGTKKGKKGYSRKAKHPRKDDQLQ